MDGDRGGDRRRRDSRDDKPARRDQRPPKDNSNPAPRRDNRDRSRSPPRRDNRNDRRRDRSPPRGPARGGLPNRPDHSHNRPRDTRGPPPRPGQHNNAGGARKPAPAPDKVPTQEIPEDEDSEAEMARVMGFQGFRTTKNTKVPGNDKNYGVSKRKTTEYRQYMNRVGGFNRPLSPGRG